MFLSLFCGSVDGGALYSLAYPTRATNIFVLLCCFYFCKNPGFISSLELFLISFHPLPLFCLLFLPSTTTSFYYFKFSFFSRPRYINDVFNSKAVFWFSRPVTLPAAVPPPLPQTFTIFIFKLLIRFLFFFFPFLIYTNTIDT